MSDTVIVNVDEGAATTEAPVEIVADASVEIARIEADRDIAVAEVRAETEQAQSEAMVAAVALQQPVGPQKDEELWAKVSALETTLAELAGMMTGLLSSTPPAAPVVIAEPEVAEAEVLIPADDGVGQPEAPTKGRRVRLL